MIPSPSHVGLQVDNSYLPEVWVSCPGIKVLFYESQPADDKLLSAWPQTLFGIGIITIALRYAVRLRTVGLWGFGGDDCCMVLFLALWTINGCIVQITYYTGGSIDVTPDVLPVLSDTDIGILVYGTKWEYASFYTYSALIWSLKFSVLFFYKRLKADDWRKTWLTVNRLFVINGVAYLALGLTAAFSCWPIHLNWTVRPLPPLRCTFRPQNFWTLVVLNVLTDVAILCVPVPILWQIRVSPMRRLGVSLLLCSGLFLISTAIIRAAFTISGAPSIITINRWGFRETAVGVMAVNAPVLAPFFSKAFWKKGPYRPGRQQEEARRNRTVIFATAWKVRRRHFSLFQLPSSLQWTKSKSSRSKGSRSTFEVSNDARDPTRRGAGEGVNDGGEVMRSSTARKGDLEAGTVAVPEETLRQESTTIMSV